MKRFLLLALIIAGWCASAHAQPAPTIEQMADADPLRCWWRTSSSAVRIGETFGVTLTCAALDSEAIQVVPDESRLAGTVISMAPFEVVASTQPQYLHGGQRRFFQYGYTLRIINPDVIGTDIPLPPIALPYRISSRIASNASLQGRNLTYVLPPLSIRVLSLVTADAPDIRDAADERFSAIEALTLRASILNVAAITLTILGLLMLIVILVRLLTLSGKRGSAEAQLLDTPMLLNQAARELAAVARTTGTGWNHALAGRAQAATRIAASCALGRTVSQKPAEHGAQPGHILASATRKFFGHSQAMLLSGGATAAAIARALAHPSLDGGHQQTLEQLQAALATFNRFQYGRGDTPERPTPDAELNTALAAATAATARLQAEYKWPKPCLRRWTMRKAGAVRQA